MATWKAKTYLSVPEPFKLVNDNWNTFVQWVKHFFLCSKQSNWKLQKLHQVLTLIGASAFNLLSNLITLQDPRNFSFNNVVEKLITHFKCKTLKVADRFCFYKKNQARSKIIAEYLAELKRQALTCKLANFLEEALCECSVQWCK